jgi:hypothetical protein
MMTQRVLPDPDKFAVCPPDGAIPPFYEGVFEAAYVLLNPFLRPRSPSVEILGDTSADEVCRNCDPVQWSEVQRLLDLPSLAAIDVALRTNIGGLVRELADEELAARLKDGLRRHNLLPPVEGMFPELSLEPVLSFIQSLGPQWLWVGDEFCTERKLHWIDDLKPAGAKTSLYRGNVFTPDRSMLWTVHWDSHFSLFCSTRENVERLRRHPALEGFACGPTTEVYWGVLNE